MANRPIKFKIDVTKILKEHLFKGNKGTYLDCAVWPNKSGGTDEYGNTHYIVQEVSKEAREQGEKGKIIGNMVMPMEQMAPRTEAARKHADTGPISRPLNGDDDDIPF